MINNLIVTAVSQYGVKLIKNICIFWVPDKIMKNSNKLFGCYQKLCNFRHISAKPLNSIYILFVDNIAGLASS